LWDRSNEASIHFIKHCQKTNGIDVEHRLGLSAVALGRIVATESQDIVKSFARKLPSFAFQAVAIEILARKMDQYFFVGIEDRFAEGHWTELRIAPCVVGYRNPINFVAMDKLRGKRSRINRLAIGNGTPCSDKFHTQQKLRSISQFIAQSVHGD